MKKYFFIFIFFIIMMVLKTNVVSAVEKGTCIIKQQNLIYNVNTPFYWYSATKDSTVNSSLVATTTYSHNETYIDNREKCLSINNSASSFIRGINNNYLNTRTINYFYSQESVNNSQEIFENSINLFSFPSEFDQGNYTITSEYISLDHSPPTIINDHNTIFLIIPINSKIDVYAIKSRISAYDEVDGIIEVNIHQDNFSGNQNVVGEFTIVFSATDDSNNTSYLTITMKVVDTIAPNILGPKSLKSFISNPLTINQIKQAIIIKDNYDLNLQDKIEIVSDNYSNNINQEGNFSISLKVSDNSNNISSIYTLMIQVYDDIPPSIIGESNYLVSSKNKLSIDSLISKIQTHDNIDASPKIEVESDMYSSFYYKPGIYQISFISTDKNNNHSTPFVVNITVTDQTKPVFYISKNFIGIDENTPIPIEEIIEIIENTNSISKENMTLTKILKDEYSTSNNKKGTYIIQLSYKNIDNEETIIESSIVVDDYLINSTEKEKNIFFNIWNIIKNLFSRLLISIKKIFSFKWFKKLI